MAEFMEVMDFILNRCTAKEIEAVEAAVNRRRKDLGEGSINPASFAKNMSKTINESVASSISSLQESLKDFAWDLVQKENPNLSEEEMNQIVDQMIPDILAQTQKSSAADALREGKSLVVDGKVNGVPVDAMLNMVMQFIRYSNGTLPPEDDRALKNALGDWPQAYWRSFPEQIQSLLRSYLKNGLDPEAFEQALAILLATK